MDRGSTSIGLAAVGFVSMGLGRVSLLVVVVVVLGLCRFLAMVGVVITVNGGDECFFSSSSLEEEECLMAGTGDNDDVRFRR